MYELLEALWARAQAEGAYVMFTGERTSGHAGMFHVPADRGIIQIVRPHYKSPPTSVSPDSRAPAGKPQPNHLEELITLAHEYGHFRSWRDRTNRDAWSRYLATQIRRDVAWNEAEEQVPDGAGVTELNDTCRRAVFTALSDQDRDRILAEETLAWQIGREVLSELGLTDFALYDERTRRGLHNHRYRLGMEDLWPEDLVDTVAE